MKIKLLIMMMSVLMFNSAADAYLVNYAVTGGTHGDTWTGTFDVTSLNVAAKDLSNIKSISAVKLSLFGTVVIIPTVTFFGNTNQIYYSQAGFSEYFVSTSTPLYSAVVGNNKTWNDLIGNPLGYTGTEITFTTNVGTVTNYDGQITFSSGGGAGGAVATPEPGTMMLLGSGVLTFGLSRFRRRKQEVVA